MKRNRIVILNDTVEIGGTEKSLKNLLLTLAEQEKKFKVISIYGDKNKGVELYSENGSYIINSFFKNVIENNAILYKVKNLILSLFFSLYPKQSVVVAFKEGECQKYALKIKADKHISWVHTNVVEFPWTSYMYHTVEEERAIYNCFDKIVTVSNACAEAIKQKFNVPLHKIEVIFNKTDYDEIDIKKKQYINCKDIEDNYFKFVCVGRLDRIKRVFALVELFVKLIEKVKDKNFKLYIIGDGEERKKIEEYIEENDLCHRVVLLGEQKNPYCFMDKCNCLVHNSLSESFGMVFVESLYLGLDIVTTNCGIAEELRNKYPNKVSVCQSEEEMLNDMENKLIMYDGTSNKESNKIVNIQEIEKSILEVVRI